MTEEKKSRSSHIQLTISLDEKNIPEQIEWEATDAEPGKHAAKAMLLGLWDKKQGNGLSIDLWTKEMTVPEMNIFFYQTLISMADTLQRATQDKQLSESITQFAGSFMERVNSTGKS